MKPGFGAKSGRLLRKYTMVLSSVLRAQAVTATPSTTLTPAAQRRATSGLSAGTGQRCVRTHRARKQHTCPRAQHNAPAILEDEVHRGAEAGSRRAIDGVNQHRLVSLERLLDRAVYLVEHSVAFVEDDAVARLRPEVRQVLYTAAVPHVANLSARAVNYARDLVRHDELHVLSGLKVAQEEAIL
jgi:hypothetical protein